MSCSHERAHTTLSKVKTRQSRSPSCVHFLKGGSPLRGDLRSDERVNPRMILSDERSSSDTQCHPLEKCSHTLSAHLSETPIRGGKNHALSDVGISPSGHLSGRRYGRHAPRGLDGRIQPQNRTGDQHRTDGPGCRTGVGHSWKQAPRRHTGSVRGLGHADRRASERPPHRGLGMSRPRVGGHVEDPGRRRDHPRSEAQSPEVGDMITQRSTGVIARGRQA